jgi:hypothetical protein
MRVGVAVGVMVVVGAGVTVGVSVSVAVGWMVAVAVIVWLRAMSEAVVGEAVAWRVVGAVSVSGVQWLRKRVARASHPQTICCFANLCFRNRVVSPLASLYP